MKSEGHTSTGLWGKLLLRIQADNENLLEMVGRPFPRLRCPEAIVSWTLLNKIPIALIPSLQIIITLCDNVQWAEWHLRKGGLKSKLFKVYVIKLFTIFGKSPQYTSVNTNYFFSNKIASLYSMLTL